MVQCFFFPIYDLNIWAPKKCRICFQGVENETRCAGPACHYDPVAPPPRPLTCKVMMGMTMMLMVIKQIMIVMISMIINVYIVEEPAHHTLRSKPPLQGSG